MSCEVAYLEIAKNLCLGKGYSSDGITPHLLFSPLYPFFAAIIYLFSGSLELASKLNFVLLGGLICLPLYFLAAEFYNRRVARISVIIMVFFPSWLASQHLWSVASEQIYTFMFISGIFVLYRAIVNNRLGLFILSAVMLAMTYLARPEGIAFLPVGVVLILIAYFFPYFRNNFKIAFNKKILNILAFVLVFIAVVSPYILYLKIHTGHYTISPKLSFNLKVGEKEFVSKALNTELSNDLPGGKEIEEVSPLIKRWLYNFLEEIKVFFNIGFFPFYILPFLLFSLLSKGWILERYYKEIFLLLFFLPPFFIIPIFFVNTRFLMPALPILIIWISNGISNFEDWLGVLFINVKKNSLLRRLPISIIIVLFLLTTFFLFKFKVNNPMEHKEVGLWIKENLPKEAKIISRGKGVISFYAEREVIDYPLNVNIKIILEYADKNNAKYLVADDIIWRSIGVPPKGIEIFLQKQLPSPDFKQIYKNIRYGRKLVFYEIQ